MLSPSLVSCSWWHHTVFFTITALPLTHAPLSMVEFHLHHGFLFSMQLQWSFIKHLITWTASKQERRGQLLHLVFSLIMELMPRIVFLEVLIGSLQWVYLLKTIYSTFGLWYVPVSLFDISCVCR